VYERYLSEGIFDGAADVARVEILHRFGGIYVDADAEAVRPLDGADWLDARFFAVAGGTPYPNGSDRSASD